MNRFIVDTSKTKSYGFNTFFMSKLCPNNEIEDTRIKTNDI